ncbi:sensor histidine kinase [Streptomyces hirsutus]|uniref:sensor histidine kinase n=1 Tax=Streptomyces hirsutus TaxID=35620 RepID=UPI003695280C
MSDSVSPARSVASAGHRRRPAQIDAFTLRHVRRAALVPLLLLGAVLAAVLVLGQVGVSHGWLLTGLVCGLVGVAVFASHGARAAARALGAAAVEAQAAELARVAGVVAAVEKSVLWSADELCRGARPPLPDRQVPRSAGPAAGIEAALGELQVQAVASLIRVHDESQSVVLLEVLRRLAKREHALVGKALEALSQLEKLTDDPELLEKIFEIDHLVTRVRRQVESTAVLGGQSLRSMRKAVSVAIVLRGAVSEVVQYPRVAVAAGAVGTELGLPGHVGPDLTHLLAELIENACECSDPATRVLVRAQRVPAGLAIEVEDRAIPMRPDMRERMNRLLTVPDEVDVSGQVRAGQVGLLVAAKIAQRHGLSIRLQENPTGGTTALVVVPARLLVPVVPAQGMSTTRHEAHRPPIPAPPRDASPAQLSPPVIPAQPVPTGGQGQPEGMPELPRRERRAGSFKSLAEREQPPVTAATPGLAAAFRRGAQASGASTSPSDQHRP